MAKISVIVPVYNTRAYLEQCLAALAGQTLVDIEVLCVDDGSTDGSDEILRRFAETDRRFRLFSQANAGPATARNLGLANASAPYVMFCDADDRYEADYCRRMLEIMEREQVDVVVCRARTVVEDKNVGSCRRAAGDLAYNSSYTGRFDLDKNMLLNTGVVLWNKIFKKSIIERQGICFPDGCEHDDDVFWLLYGMFAKTIFFLPDMLYNYRIRAGSIMGNYFDCRPKDKYDRFKICNFAYSFLQNKRMAPGTLPVFAEFCRRQAEMMFFELFAPEELRTVARKLNRIQREYLFVEHGEKLFSAKKQGMETAGMAAYVGYWLLSKISFGADRLRFREKKKTIRAQLKVKRFLAAADKGQG